MDPVPGPKEVSVRVPKISGWKDGDPYPNRKLSGTQYRVPNIFGSGFGYPIIQLSLTFFLPNNLWCDFFGFLLLVDCCNFLV